ncbi:BCCT family transporter [Corynebacterium tapiri]|uniref:BCCT family transporter n=1 Tax=Corynebacterium tapiri TaxID=1448266 RepID=A0A5C4U8K0_9CORY|nr:BCCT family transporter [Corynebacterium tapiri]TNM00497.1 BCCT family transporter [Corynebacterium tapiri]
MEEQDVVIKRHRNRVRKAVSGERSIHPALAQGIDVDTTDRSYPTNKLVFAMALIISLAVVMWAFLAPDQVNTVGVNLQSWVVSHLGWLFTLAILGATIFMLVIGYGPTGSIRLGADDTRPEFSTFSWVSMLFAAGLGIGLIFYGPMEPLIHFQTLPPAFTGTDAEAGTVSAVDPAVAQSILHQASFPWVVYSFVGGAIAYSAFRRGRLPLISSIFEPVFPHAPNHPVGKIIDVFAVLVTLFGTATSLGIGALQVQTGTSILTGKDLSGDGTVVAIISILTVIFTFSAVSGVKTGIRILSNANMALVAFMALFVLVLGPTVFILDLIPTSLVTFLGAIPDFFAVSPSQGDVEKEFVTAWTMLYWAWWISWSPFVGMFVAKISKGRTLREYVTVTIFAPAAISALWYIVFGGTAIWQTLEGMDLPIVGAGENVMFDLFDNLPLSTLMHVVTLAAIIIFFTTAGDSTTNVLGSMSQSGRSNPSTPITVIWGLALGLIALALLLAGGQNALSGLQSIMVSASVPFVVIMFGMAISWAKDLANDPVIIRRAYSREAIRKGVMRGIDKHGDDFVFGVSEVPADEGAGADVTLR